MAGLPTKVVDLAKVKSDDFELNLKGVKPVREIVK
jgi:hypothetical protein